MPDKLEPERGAAHSDLNISDHRSFVEGSLRSKILEAGVLLLSIPSFAVGATLVGDAMLGDAVSQMVRNINVPVVSDFILGAARELAAMFPSQFSKIYLGTGVAVAPGMLGYIGGSIAGRISQPPKK